MSSSMRSDLARISQRLEFPRNASWNPYEIASQSHLTTSHGAVFLKYVTLDMEEF